MQGFLTLGSVVSNGQNLTPLEAVKRGLVKVQSTSEAPAGWGVSRHEIPLGYNLMVDNGRQFLAYLFGGMTPASSFTCSRFSIGTGTLAPNVSNTDLQTPIAFYEPAPSAPLITTKPVSQITFPAPMIALVELALAASEANGLLITEWGLNASADSGVTSTLLCRKVEAGLEKNQTAGTNLLWRLRFVITFLTGLHFLTSTCSLA